MSVSDVVVIEDEKGKRAYYVNSFGFYGFYELPQFISEKPDYSKETEQSISFGKRQRNIFILSMVRRQRALRGLYSGEDSRISLVNPSERSHGVWESGNRKRKLGFGYLISIYWSEAGRGYF